MNALRVAAAVDLWLSAAMVHLGQLLPPVAALYLALAGVAVLPGMWSGLLSVEAPRSTHDPMHAPVPGNVTHVTVTSYPSLIITPGESTHESSHAMHAPGAVTRSPPSVQGGA